LRLFGGVIINNKEAIMAILELKNLSRKIYHRIKPPNERIKAVIFREM